MNDGFQFFDIILFAMVAAFLVLRLRGVLGRRTGTEQRRDPFRRQPEQPQTAKEGPDRSADDRVIELPRRGEAPAGETGTGSGLAQISIADRSFNAESFLAGARAAFEMIVGAFARGDKDKLRGLLSNEVFDNFARAIDGRASRGETLETKLVAIRSADITAAEMRGQTAFVTVTFVSEQINVTRDKEGRIIDGEPGRAQDVTDAWTFARNTRARDPNWTLVETHSPG